MRGHAPPIPRSAPCVQHFDEPVHGAQVAGGERAADDRPEPLRQFLAPEAPGRVEPRHAPARLEPVALGPARPRPSARSGAGAPKRKQAWPCRGSSGVKGQSSRAWRSVASVSTSTGLSRPLGARIASRSAPACASGLPSALKMRSQLSTSRQPSVSQSPRSFFMGGALAPPTLIPRRRATRVLGGLRSPPVSPRGPGH